MAVCPKKMFVCVS